MYRFGGGTDEASCSYNGFIVSTGVGERGKRKLFSCIGKVEMF